jgi:NADP-dependent 3-hydroxy acid dehydrogenase YdfG
MSSEPRPRTAIVTGASRGIGLAIAEVLIGDGVRVAMVARGTAVLEQHAARLGPLALPTPCDVGDASAVARAVSTVGDAFGGAPDVVVSNAGLFVLAPVEATSLEDFRATLDVNLVAPFLLARAVLPAMRAARRGHLITIGSIADHTTFPENGAYAASKHGVRALHEVLRAELRGSGVRATLVSPGPVDTSLWDDIDPDSRAGFTPRRDMLAPDAVAAAVRYVVRQPADVNVDELRLSHS